MDLDSLRRDIELESLDTPVIYGDTERENDSIVLDRDGVEYKVFISNERGGMHKRTFRTFDNESDALAYTLELLRKSKKAEEALQSLKEEFPDGLFANAPYPPTPKQ